MLIVESEKIAKAMHNIVNESINHHHMREMIGTFIDYQDKKGFPFGELTLLHYKMLNGIDHEDIYQVCAAVELLILGFDIFDDFEDNDSINGEQPWLNQQHLSMNAATSLLFLCTKALRETNFPSKEMAASILLEYALKSIHGQHSDLLNTCKTEKDYIEMTMMKSGSLVTLACLIGAVLAKIDYPEEIKLYSGYIGLIGQVTNDLEDIRAWDRKNDLLNKKYTLPIMYLLNQKDDVVTLIKEYYADHISNKEIIKHKDIISKKFVETGALIYSEVIKRNYQKKAMAEIQKLNIDRHHFDQLIRYST